MISDKKCSTVYEDICETTYREECSDEGDQSGPNPFLRTLYSLPAGPRRCKQVSWGFDTLGLVFISFSFSTVQADPYHDLRARYQGKVRGHPEGGLQQSSSDAVQSRTPRELRGSADTKLCAGERLSLARALCACEAINCSLMVE